MKFFVTGHTGFKGAWLCAMLLRRGYDVSGYSIDVPNGGLFSRLNMQKLISRDFRGDIRDYHQLESSLRESMPEIVVHLAAQPLVRESYEKPLETYETNTQGTINLLQAMKKVVPGAFLLAVTTDKVYENVGKVEGYLEEDKLGFSDPYSTSKAMADMALQAWALNFPEMPRLAIARAGNVIGPLDVSDDRLIPDIIRASIANERVVLRNPDSVRPWQHVLDCLTGYIALIDRRDEFGHGAWNFGPSPSDIKKVSDVAVIAGKIAQVETTVESSSGHSKPEQQLLTLSSVKARAKLDWFDKFSFNDAVVDSVSKDLFFRRISDSHELGAQVELYLSAFEARD